MTGTSLRAVAVRLVAQAMRTGTREAIGAIDGAEVGAEFPRSVPRKRAASDLLAYRKRAALSVDCMGISLGMLVLDYLEAFVMQLLLY